MSSSGVTALVLVAVAATVAVSAFSETPIHPSQGMMPHHLKYQLQRQRQMKSAGGGVPLVSSTSVGYEPEIYMQTIDHTGTIPGRFKQRYWVNATHFKAGAAHKSPVYLFIEGEGPSVGRWVTQGHMTELASRTGALLLSLEHRFYGASVPTANMDNTNIKLLTSQQALADLAEFTQFAITQFNLSATDNPFFSFGGSYAGALSSFYRLKYPNAVYGAVSSSGPVRAIEDFEAYNDVIFRSYGNSLVGGSSACTDAITSAFQTVNDVLTNPASPITWRQLEQDFTTCGNITTRNDTITFAASLADTIKGIAQYNLNKLYGYNIAAVCQIMTGPSIKNDYERLVQVFSAINTGPANNGSCLDPNYWNMVNSLKNSTLDIEAAGRQWTWQTCNEFGYFQSCEHVSQGGSCMFSTLETVGYYTDLCFTVFGLDAQTTFNKIAATNAYYGAQSPTSTRVQFINGLIDPWHALSVLSPLSETQPAFTIADGSHCSDMSATHPTDPADLTAARVIVDCFVDAWIGEFRGQNATKPNCLPPNPPNDSKSGLTTAEKALIGAGAAVGAIVLIGFIVYCVRRSKGSESNTDNFAKLAGNQ